MSTKNHPPTSVLKPLSRKPKQLQSCPECGLHHPQSCCPYCDALYWACRKRPPVRSVSTSYLSNSCSKQASDNMFHHTVTDTEPILPHSLSKLTLALNIVDKAEVADVLQSNNEPSSRTPRGHQFPAAFLQRVSGLDKNGIGSPKPMKYTHVDIAGSSGSLPNEPTGCPVVGFSSYFLLPYVK